MGVDAIVKQFVEADYEKDEKQKSIVLTEDGTEKAERMLEAAGLIEGHNLYDIANTQVVHHLNQALKANKMFKRDIDYIEKDGKIVIIDEFTGRMMDGRRWSDGLHQAVEAKEGVQIEPENQTLASITFQNYFRMYPKLSGHDRHGADRGARILRHLPHERGVDPDQCPGPAASTRTMNSTRISPTSSAPSPRKSSARQEKGQPVLVGTVSIEKSEMLSEFLEQGGHPARGAECPLPRERSAYRRAGRPHRRGDHRHQHGRPRHRHQTRRQPRIPHRGRAQGNAEGPERDKAIERIAAEIEAEKQRVLEAGGLFVLGTERHESRRIDNQLRGRSGRQGDPGLSRFYLSLDDDLLRIFGPQTAFARLMNKNLEDGEAIVTPWISKAIETAQKKVEARNYDIRKQVVEFDDVMNDQRKVIYEQRAEIMDADHVSDVVEDFRAETIAALVTAIARRGPIPSSGTSSASRKVSTRCSTSIRRSTTGWPKKRSNRTSSSNGCRSWPTPRWRPSSRGVEPRTLDPGRKESADPDARPSSGRSIWRRSTRCAR